VKHKTTRVTYRLRKWSAYNAALMKCANLGLCVSEEMFRARHDAAHTGKRSTLRTCSDVAQEDGHAWERSMGWHCIQ
jgi:hypothetical protein